MFNEALRLAGAWRPPHETTPNSVQMSLSSAQCDEMIAPRSDQQPHHVFPTVGSRLLAGRREGGSHPEAGGDGSTNPAVWAWLSG